MLVVYGVDNHLFNMYYVTYNDDYYNQCYVKLRQSLRSKYESKIIYFEKTLTYFLVKLSICDIDLWLLNTQSDTEISQREYSNSSMIWGYNKCQIILAVEFVN